MKELKPHQQRVLAEKIDLEDKLYKLCDFISGDVFDTLNEAEQDRLHCQRTIMFAYRDILQARINAF